MRVIVEPMVFGGVLPASCVRLVWVMVMVLGWMPVLVRRLVREFEGLAMRSAEEMGGEEDEKGLQGRRQ